MKKYKVKMRDEAEDRNMVWWINFSELVFEKGGETGLPSAGESDEYRIYTSLLKEYNAYDIPKTSYLTFDTEEDFIVFKLKFS